ncbi:MAG TPA: hypothetical protein VG405_04915 [Solirubrobacteraceae bacterium]|jgi:methyl-accepting chemotaxis protein|nr:hypothetical protein [Solirubrobacteraceae bacterium]
MLEQFLFPPRLVMRAFDDLHRAADAVVRMSASAEALRDEVAGVRRLMEPIPGELDALRVEFGGSNDEIAKLREAFGPELTAVRRAAEEISQSVRQLTRDADEMRDVVEPLQTATERVGRIAERIPGGGRKG